MNIDLAKPELLPKEFVAGFRNIEVLCKKYDFSEELVEHEDVIPLVRRLDDFCMNGSVIGVHYTRAVKENIEKVRTTGSIRSRNKE